MTKGDKWIIFLLVVLNIVVITALLAAQKRLGTVTGEIEKFKSKIGKWF